MVAEAPFVCSPLSGIENSVGKKRFVINLRHLNRFLRKQRFRYEDLRVAMTLFEKGDYLFSFDLKAGYHHIDIAETHRKYIPRVFMAEKVLCVHSSPLWFIHCLLYFY